MPQSEGVDCDSISAESRISNHQTEHGPTPDVWSDQQRLVYGNVPRRPHFLLNWWQEMAACVVFVAALLALFATLYKYSGKPSPDWPEW